MCFINLCKCQYLNIGNTQQGKIIGNYTITHSEKKHIRHSKEFMGQI